MLSFWRRVSVSLSTASSGSGMLHPPPRGRPSGPIAFASYPPVENGAGACPDPVAGDVDRLLQGVGSSIRRSESDATISLLPGSLPGYPAVTEPSVVWGTYSEDNIRANLKKSFHKIIPEDKYPGLQFVAFLQPFLDDGEDVVVKRGMING